MSPHFAKKLRDPNSFVKHDCHPAMLNTFPQVASLGNNGGVSLWKAVPRVRFIVTNHWLLLAESRLTRRLFGSMVRRIAALPLQTG